MGKETGFLELDREDRTYEDPKVRMPAVRELGLVVQEEQTVVAAIHATELLERMGAQDRSIHDVLPLEPFLTVDLLWLGRWDLGVRHDQGS